MPHADAMQTPARVVIPMPSSPQPTGLAPAPKDAVAGLQDADLAFLTQRRNNHRWPFDATQKVIPIIDGRPDKDLARDVHFHDISISGVAFQWRRPPEFEEAVVVLDKLPEAIYVRVRVERCNVISQSPRTFLVGCSFVERMKGM